MPGINKVRVTNVNFKRNTRRYDDLIIPMNSLNTLIDGENGDGKTLYAQCAFQSIIPNSYFHPDNTIKKLFKDNSNSTIHSMIEWELDRDNEYDFMITGFCAKDSQKDNEDDKKTFEYFNYVILYKKDFKFSVESIPLKVEKEDKVKRMGYRELKEFLRRLGENEKNCFVKVFNIKKDYLSFLYNYGINEAEWNLQFNTNRQEGGAENYFTTKYKHPKDLITQEIIPIIESIDRYRLGEEATNEVLAKSLLNISKNIKQLTEKTQRLNELNVVEACLNRIVAFNNDLQQALNDKNDTFIEIVKGYNKEILMITELTDKILELESKKDDLEEECQKLRGLREEISEKIELKDTEKEQADLDLKEVDKIERILENRKRKENLLKEISDLEKEKELVLIEIEKISLNNTELKSKLDELEKIKIEKRAENTFIEYKGIDSKAQQNQLELDNYNRSNEEIFAKKKETESMYLYALNRLEDDLNKSIEIVDEDLNKIELESKDVVNKTVENRTKLGENKLKIDNCKKDIDDFTKKIQDFTLKRETLELNSENLLLECKSVVESIREVEINNSNIGVCLDKINQLIDSKNVDEIENIALKELSSVLEEISKQIDLDTESLRKDREKLEDDSTKNDLQNEISLLETKIKDSFEEEKELLSRLNKLKSDIKSNDYKMEELIKAIDLYKEEVESIKEAIKETNSEDRFEHERVLNLKVSTLKNKSFELNTKKGELDSKLIDLNNNEGLSLSKETLKCFEIVEGLYSSALLGRDFIKSLPIATKEQYLSKTTLIPYGILLNEQDYNSLIKNEGVKNKLGDYLTPIINMDALKGIDMLDESVIYFNTLSKDVFIDEDRIQEEIKKVELELSKIEKEVENLHIELLESEKQLKQVSVINIKYDIDFSEVKTKELISYQDENAIIKKEIAFKEESLIAVQEKRKNIDNSIIEIKDKIAKHEEYIKAEIKNINAKLDNLQEYNLLNKSRVELVKNIGTKIEEYKNDLSKIAELKLEIEKYASQIEESKQSTEMLLSENRDIEENISGLNLKSLELEELKKEKDNSKADKMLKLKEVLSYKADIPVGTFEKETNISIDNLREQVKVFNRKMEEEFSRMKELEDNIKDAKEQCLRKKTEIESLNISFEELEKKSDVLTYNDPEVFKSIDKRIHAVKQEISTSEENLKASNDNKVRIVATIDTKTLDAKKIDISEDVVIEENYSVENKRRELNELIKSIKAQKKELDKESKKYLKEEDEHRREISNIEEELRKEQSELNKVESQKSSTEDLMKANNINSTITQEVAESLTFVKSHASKKIEWHDNKISNIKSKHTREIDDTCARLENSVFEFVSVLKDITPPSTIEEVLVQNNSIVSDEGYLHYLNQERESLDRELEDLNLMKAEFINKCVNSVEILIEKLKNLSKQSTVVLNDKKIRLIELKLYELNQEQKIEKMTNYIDSLLRHLDKELEENQEESIKILNQALTSSKLLEQGVRNLKNCEVNIYVPDSVKVEEGYYEKWGGGASSGQRNIMYLTTVMALIVFIRESSSLKSASENTKVLYGDGPFRGASASYLWEPVFKMMQENNIQFVVTNYATPPALMNLFSSVAMLAGVETLLNGKRIAQNELKMDSIFKENTKSLRGENIMVKYEDYKIPVVRKTPQKDSNVDDSQLTLDFFMDEF